MELFAYAVSEQTTGGPLDFHLIATDEFVEFVRERPAVLPDQVRRWLGEG